MTVVTFLTELKEIKKTFVPVNTLTNKVFSLTDRLVIAIGSLRKVGRRLPKN